MRPELCDLTVAVAAPGAHTLGVTTTSLLHSILDWLLRSTPLTENQIKEVVRNLTADGSSASADGEFDDDEIASFIKDVTHHDAGPENVQRVAATLAAAGWPLSGVGKGDG
jgi:tellurite resistance protein